MHPPTTLFLLFFLRSLPLASALSWPSIFPQTKRFREEGLISAGALGMGGVEGVVKAFGDWDGDQFMDTFTTSLDRKELQIYQWSHKKFLFFPTHNLTFPTPIISVVPSDFNHDGHLDVLVLTEEEGGWWGGTGEGVKGEVYFGGGRGGGFSEWADVDVMGTLWNESPPLTLPSLTPHQPLLLDATGTLSPDLLAMAHGVDGGKERLGMWENLGGGFELGQHPLRPKAGEKICKLASPHSNAFIDFDGDCLPDIFLTCQGASSNRKSFQIWRNEKEQGFGLMGEWELPDGVGAVSFADMDRDGTIDLIFPTCRTHDHRSGIGTGCAINIAYNKQPPFCAQGLTVMSQEKGCRDWRDLCKGSEVGFDFSVEGNSFTRIPIESLYPGTSTLLFSTPTTSSSSESVPLPLRLGDFNVDGFPDLFLLLANSTASPGGLFGGSAGVQGKILRSASCAEGGEDEEGVCEGGKKEKGRRRFEVIGGKEGELLDSMWDVEDGSWLDIDEDGSLDLMLQRSGKQSGEKITFIQNNIFHDAFFLKTLALNGACEGECESSEGGKKYNAYGVNSPGATFKFTVLDTGGKRVATQIAQMGQTGYNALQTPYSFFGLGRTNNYVENLFIGSSLHSDQHYTNIEGVIPNSQVIVNPPQPLSNRTAPVTRISQDWHKELYLTPGQWIHWVIAALVAVMLVLMGIVWGLHQSEKLEDEKERRRALHSINFQAL